MEHYIIEVTDTYAGDANYSWVKRFKVKARSQRGAMIKFNRQEGFTRSLRKSFDTGEISRYDVQSACICVFVWHCTESEYNDSFYKVI